MAVLPDDGSVGADGEADEGVAIDVDTTKLTVSATKCQRENTNYLSIMAQERKPFWPAMRNSLERVGIPRAQASLLRVGGALRGGW